MKKLLAGCSAIALAGTIATQAAAADWEILQGFGNPAGSDMAYAAPGTAFDGSYPVGDDVFLGTLGATSPATARHNDAPRFTYFTPRISGFQAGVSYAHDDVRNLSVRECDDCAGLNDLVDVGANYVRSFGDANVAISGRWGTASAADGQDPDVWALGANVGYAGFTIGGSYAKQSGTGLRDAKAYDAGVSYATGPLGLSVTYFRGRNRDGGDAGPGRDDETLEQFLLGARYKLGKGVSVNAFGAYVDVEERDTDSKLDSWVIGTGVKINF